MPRVRVPQHIARLVTRLVVDYFAYIARLVVDFFAYALRSGASARRAARRRPVRHVTRLVARFVARLVIDFFTYAARLGASAHRAARRRPLRRVAWLVVDYFAYAARPGTSKDRHSQQASTFRGSASEGHRPLDKRLQQDYHDWGGSRPEIGRHAHQLPTG
jgi:hypothetical protein